MENLSQYSRVLKLLKKYGTDSLSYFHLQDDRKYFFSPDGQSCISYKIYNGVALVSGDPIGNKHDTFKLIQSFIIYCNVWNLKVCFMSISRETQLYLSKVHFKAKRIGEEAVIHLPSFERSRLKKRVRRAVRYCESLGIDIFFYSANNLPSFLMKELQEISDEWLAHKGKKEKGYSMTLRRLPNKNDQDCLIAVAVKDNHAIGFSTFVPIYQTEGFSLDLIRKKYATPNGLNEFLIIKTLEYLKNKHIQMVTLNFATFVYSFPSQNKIKTAISKTLASFFKCDSLYAFNTKFNPIWVSRYISFANYKDVPRLILAIIQAER